MDFIEAIPYKETQGYVTSIIRNYYWYSRLLGLDEPESLLYFWKPYKELGKDLGQPESKPYGPSAKSKVARVEDIQEEEVAPKVMPTEVPITTKSLASPSQSPAPSPSASMPAVHRDFAGGFAIRFANIITGCEPVSIRIS